jgi:hypothetical protein
MNIDNKDVLSHTGESPPEVITYVPLGGLVGYREFNLDFLAKDAGIYI